MRVESHISDESKYKQCYSCVHVRATYFLSCQERSRLSVRLSVGVFFQAPQQPEAIKGAIMSRMDAFQTRCAPHLFLEAAPPSLGKLLGCQLIIDYRAQ